MTTTDAPLLQVRDLHVSYRRHGAEVPAVRGVGLALGRGERLAVIGESGSGKSTLTQALLGILPPSASVHAEAVTLDGVTVQDGERGLPEKEWLPLRRGRIAYVPQDPNIALNPVARIGRQLAEAIRLCEPEVERAARPRRAVQLLEEVGIEDAARVHDAYPHQLSGGQRQRVLLAVALAGDPVLLVADEPTSGLDVEVQKRVLDLLDEIVERTGVGVVLVTHDLAVAAGRSDHLVVLADGRIVEQGPTAQVVAAPRHATTRLLLDAVPRLRVHERDAAPEPAGAGGAGGAGATVRLEGLTRTYQVRDRRGRRAVHAVQGVDLEIPAGTTYGLVGQSGSGKSTIGRLLAGIDRPDAGDVLIGGRALTRGPREERRAAARAVQYVFQNPYGSLDSRHTIRRILAEPLEGAGLPHRGAEAEARLREAVEAVALPAATLDRRPGELSGGQRQRIAIARGIITRPALLVLDEPVSALDVSVQAQVIEVIGRVQQEVGMTCLFISHDLAVISEISHRVGVLRHGELVEEGTPVQLLTAPAHEYTRRLVEAAPVLAPAA